jgi:N-acetylneuraminic acid mutarotase
VVFTGRLWVVGGAEGRAPRSDAWSSLDGITWTQAGSAVILGTAEGLRAAVVGTRLYITGAAFSSMYTQQVFYTDTGNSWTGTGVTVPFERRIETAFYSYQNRLWVYGGDTHDAYQDPSCCTRSDLWSSANGGIWTYEHTSAPYSPYRGQQLVEFGGKLWLLGPGRDGVSRAWSSENGDDWVNVPGANVLPQRVWPGVISFAGKLWMIGGLDGDTGNPASFKNDVWSSADGNTWTRVLANAPFTARYAHAVYVANGRLFVAGGVEGPPYVRPTDIWSTSDGVTWRQDLVSAPFGARVGHKVAALNGRLWLTGGSDELNQFPSDVWSSVDGINWRQDLVSDSRLRRYEHQLTAFNGRLWMTAGRDTTYAESRDLLSSADGVNWRTEAAPNWSARTSHAVAAFGTHLFLFGGEGATYDENRENEFWRTDDGVTWRLRHHNLIPVP